MQSIPHISPSHQHSSSPTHQHPHTTHNTPSSSSPTASKPPTPPPRARAQSSQQAQPDRPPSRSPSASPPLVPDEWWKGDVEGLMGCAWSGACYMAVCEVAAGWWVGCHLSVVGVGMLLIPGLVASSQYKHSRLSRSCSPNQQRLELRKSSVTYRVKQCKESSLPGALLYCMYVQHKWPPHFSHKLMLITTQPDGGADTATDSG